MTRISKVYGVGQALFDLLPPPLQLQTAPTSNQTNFDIGQIVYVGSSGAVTFYMYAGAGVWDTLETSNVAVTSVSGTANQITASPTTGAVVLSLPAAITAPGSLTTTTSLAATTTVTGGTGVIATTGNFTASAAGAGIVLNSGTASGTTTATLNGRSGQVTITTPTINAGSTFSFALTNSSITGSTTQVLYGLTGGTTGSAITIQSVTNSASTSTIVVQNASAVTNSTGSLVLTFLVLN